MLGSFGASIFFRPADSYARRLSEYLGTEDKNRFASSVEKGRFGLRLPSTLPDKNYRVFPRQISNLHPVKQALMVWGGGDKRFKFIVPRISRFAMTRPVVFENACGEGLDLSRYSAHLTEEVIQTGDVMSVPVTEKDEFDMY